MIITKLKCKRCEEQFERVLYKTHTRANVICDYCKAKEQNERVKERARKKKEALKNGK